MDYHKNGGKDTSTKVATLNLKNNNEGDIQHLIKFSTSKIKGAIDMTACFFSKDVKFKNCGYTHDLTPTTTKGFATIELFDLTISSNGCEYHDPDQELHYDGYTECVNKG